MAEQNIPPVEKALPPPSEKLLRPPTLIEKYGKVRLVIIAFILVAIIDLCIYFFLIKPDTSELLPSLTLSPTQTPLASPVPTVLPTVLPTAAYEKQASGSPEIACTMDAKQCPDGSWVGRIGPKCEFAACPK